MHFANSGQEQPIKEETLNAFKRKKALEEDPEISSSHTHQGYID